MRPTYASAPRRTAVGILALLLVSGCSDPAGRSPGASVAAQTMQNRSASASNAPATVTQQPLDAETLADLLGVEAWTFRYSGGPAHCWLEIAEVGQQTMPARLPEHASLDLAAPEGQIVLSWRRTLSGFAGGEIRLQGNGTIHALDLNGRSFIYGWDGSRVSCTPQGKQRVVSAGSGGEQVLMTYHARETVAENATPREVTLQLKLRPGPAPAEPPQQGGERN